MHDKVERLGSCPQACWGAQAQGATVLRWKGRCAKTDLVTQMVHEFQNSRGMGEVCPPQRESLKWPESRALPTRFAGDSLQKQ